MFNSNRLERQIENVSLSKRQKSVVNLAIKAAYKSPCCHKHGAVLLNGNSLINISHNSYDYSSFGERFNRNSKRNWHATRHAEMSVCLNISFKLTFGATIYVVRVNKKGELVNSKPCDMCQSIMQFCGVKRVIFSDATGFSIIKF